jgi:hypothetical protein
MRPDTMAGGHLSVHLIHSSVQSQVPVLLVRVVVPSAGLVPYPDAKVLCLCWPLLKNLQQSLLD